MAHTAHRAKSTIFWEFFPKSTTGVAIEAAQNV